MRVSLGCAFVVLLGSGCGEVKSIPADAGNVDAAPLPTDAPPDGTPMATLTVVTGGAGDGTITSSPAGIACGETCTASLAVGTLITLTAAPSTGTSFTGWGGACSGSILTCSFELDGNTVVNADFAVAQHAVTVTLTGAGVGSVTSEPTAINCPGLCADTIDHGTALTLTATPQAGSIFLGWSGGSCTGTGTCVVTVSAATAVTAQFGPTYSLSVTRTGNGSGAVTSNPTGISCGSDCDEAYPGGTMVTLTAVPSADSTFAGWTGGCAGTSTCTVTMNAAVAVNATFTLRQYTLTATRDGAGGGTIASTPAGISCGVDCTEAYNHGTNVSLTATPDATSLFTGWAGACTGVGVCVVTMDAAQSVTATFVLQTSGLNVVRAGTGSGSVSSNPAGISCGADCTEAFAIGTVVTLTAAADTGSTFTGWSGGGCTGTSTCTVTTTASPTTVTATFTLKQYALTVTKNGTGAGTVTSNPAGISCGADCTETLNFGSQITLTGTPSTGSTFTGWTGGGCTGTAPCTVTISDATAVTATFTLNQYTLTVKKTGNGFGLVTGTGISCGADCSQVMNHGASVTLTAVASTTQAELSTFVGWSGGGCTGTGTCTVTVTASTTVSPTFTQRPNYVFVTSTTQNGAVGGIAGADAICQQRATAGGLAGTYRAFLSTSSVSAATRLGTASGWIRPDGRIFARSQADLYAGRHLYPPRLNESGTDVGFVSVRTASTLAGATNGGTCSNWTAADSTSASQGYASGASNVFSNIGSSACSNATRFYCFGIDRVAPLPAPGPAVGRRAFVSSSTFNTSTGIAGADAICAANATAAGLPGSYLAFMATTTASAASRFTGTTPWNRVDNVRLGTPAQLFSGTMWDAPINVYADGGGYLGNSGSWTGAPKPTSVGTTASTCGNWSNTAGTGTNGRVGDSAAGPGFANQAAAGCGSSFRVYCLQQ